MVNKRNKQNKQNNNNNKNRGSNNGSRYRGKKGRGRRNTRRSGLIVKHEALGSSFISNPQSPKISSLNGSVRMTIERKVKTIVTLSNDFTNHEIEINPGLSATFPWLSKIAAAYTRYSIHSLYFRYEPTVAKTVSGQFMTAWNYDPDALMPTTDQVLSGSTGYQASAIHTGTINRMKPVNKILTIRSGVLEDDDEYKLYDPADFYYATSGYTGEIGVLFVGIDVSFMDPVQTPDRKSVV